MKMETHESLLKTQFNESGGRLLWATGLAILVHLVVLALFACAPRMKPPKRHFQPAIQVDLVSAVPEKASASLMPAQSSAAQQSPDKSAAVPAKKKIDAVRKPKKIKAPEILKNDAAVPLAEDVIPEKAVSPLKPFKKQALKKKTYRADNVSVVKTDQPTETQSQKKSEKLQNTDTDRHSAAAETSKGVSSDVFDRLKEKVEKQRRDQQGGGVGSGVIGTGEGTDIETVYLYRVADDIQRNWAFSRRLAGKQTHLRAVLFFKILPDGQIKDIVFETRSGNRYLDESAYKAIIKSNPVSPHPAGIDKPVVVAAYGFTPEGME